MTRDQILELADTILGERKYNPGRVIAFAQACEREGMRQAVRIARNVDKATNGDKAPDEVPE